MRQLIVHLSDMNSVEYILYNKLHDTMFDEIKKK